MRRSMLLLAAVPILALLATDAQAQVTYRSGNVGYGWGNPGYGSGFGYGQSYGYGPSYGYGSGYGWSGNTFIYPSYRGYYAGPSGYYAGQGYRSSYYNAPGSFYSPAYSTYGYSTPSYSAPSNYITPVGYVRPAGLTGVSPTSPADASAHVRVMVPQDASVWFGDSATTQTGMDRLFVSPPLEPGRKYTYRIKAQWSQDGTMKTRTIEREVQAGDWANVDFLAAEQPGQPTRTGIIPAASEPAPLPPVQAQPNPNSPASPISPATEVRPARTTIQPERKEDPLPPQ